MKGFILSLTILLFVPFLLNGQTNDLTSKCVKNSDPNTIFLKDFPIQLGKGVPQAELRWKQVFPLSKNMKYRFTLCNADNSTGQLIMKIFDSQGNFQAGSFDAKSGKIYPKIDFTCSKTGTYNLYFDFLDFKPGSGVGIVSLVK
jgi:hypothetical protein